MPTCWDCKEEIDDPEDQATMKVDGKRRKLHVDCADRLREELEIAEESESVIQDMMGFKGRR